MIDLGCHIDEEVAGLIRSLKIISAWAEAGMAVSIFVIILALIGVMR